MAKRIVVALRRHDRIEEVLPCIEKIARPGMRVVFLLPYPVKLWAYLSDQRIDTNSPTKAMLAGTGINYRCSWEMQRGLAEQKMAPVRESLRKMDVEAVAHVYTGNLRRLLATFAVEQETHLMMILRGTRRWRRIGRKIPFLRFLERPISPPVMLLHV